MAEEYNNNNQGAMYAPDEMEEDRQDKNIPILNFTVQYNV